MRTGLLDYLVCPICHSEFTLIGERTSADGQVEEGVLRCRKCSARYPISRGVPRFQIADEHGIHNVALHTKRTYNFTWRRFGKREIEKHWEKDSYQYAGLIPPSLISGEDKVGLDAGCGDGADLLRLADGGAELIGIDFSDGVDVAYQMTRHLTNIHIVQADIHRLPFRPKNFDFIYSFGVLHHLVDPTIGLGCLVRWLKPGCPLIAWLYEDFSNRTFLEQVLLAGVRGFRRVTSRLPAGLLYAFCWALVLPVWLFCAVPSRLLRRGLPHLYERIPFRHTLRWPVLAADLFDRFAPPIEWRFSHEGVLQLFKQAGLERVEVCRHRGWVSWGFKSDADVNAGKSLREA